MFDFAWKFTLAHEGGLCDDKDDPGGITKYGVDLRMMKDLAQIPSARERLHELGVKLPISRASIINLTKTQAAAIYKFVVWDALGLSRYSVPVASVLFDGGVLHGNSRSTRFVQAAHNAMHPAFILAEDGILGPKTRQAITTDAPQKLARLALDEREAWYHRHVEAVPAHQKFLRGWLNRVRDLRAYLGL